MRTRKEIYKSVAESDAKTDAGITNSLLAHSLEVLLDIRDLLSPLAKERKNE